MNYLMGIDVGTTSARAILISSDGKFVAEGLGEYPMRMPRPAWAEQDPADWADGTRNAIHGALRKAKVKPDHIAGVGLTGQMHSSVFLDKENGVIRPAILWCDGRTGAECAEITKRVSKEVLLEEARNIALPGFTAPKILWLKNHEPEAYRRLRHVLVTKDYIRFLMTGVFATEVSDASGMLLLNVARRDWSEAILEALDIPREWLPEVYESPKVTGRVSREGAKLFGLAEGTPVVGGGGDQAAGAVGNGIIRAGDCTISLGTSGVVFAPSSKPPVATGTTIHVFCHAVPRMWHTMGVMLSAGGSVQWFRNTMRRINPMFTYNEMDNLAESAPAGADGLIFLPYLTGERTPMNDPNARGVFAGLTLAHDISRMARAVLEGVAFGLCDSADMMRDIGVPLKNIYISGGGAQSDLWCAIIASALARPVRRLDVDQGPAMGAALLAGVGSGVWKNVAQATKYTLKVKDEIRPVKEWERIYREGHKRYRALYPALKDYFKV